MEEFRKVAGYEDYFISNIGRVFSKQKNNSAGGFLKPGVSKGYKHVTLCTNGKRKIEKVHRLVAAAFIENMADKPQVNHKDGDKLNNIADNLEWCTASENGKHAYTTGLSRCRGGEDAGNAKLKNSDIPTIRKMITSGMRQIDIAKQYGVTRESITSIKMGRNWKSIV